MQHPLVKLERLFITTQKYVPPSGESHVKEIPTVLAELEIVEGMRLHGKYMQAYNTYVHAYSYV